MSEEREYYHDIELINYYIRKISSFCKEHRCATCHFYLDDKCTFLKDSPCDWKGIEEQRGGAE